MTMQADFAQAPNWALPKFISKNRLLLRLVVAHFLLAMTAEALLDTPFHMRTMSMLMMMFSVMVPLLLMLMAFRHLFVMAVFTRPKSPTKQFLIDVRTTFLDADRMLSGATALLAISLFIGAFSYFKVAIPEIDFFTWDPLLAQIDRTLHFGVDPYKITMALFGTPLATSFLNANYHLWLFLNYFVILLACFAKKDMITRNTFLVAYVLIWAIGGNGIATLFSSAGPVYFQMLEHGSTYTPLMETLRAFNEISPVWALDVHDMLWQGLTGEGPVKGISAMPSMHVASSVLMTLYAYRYARWAGHIMTAFTVLIMLGSVHLAWHYAIDGYVSILLTLGCWKLAHWMVTRQAQNDPI